MAISTAVGTERKSRIVGYKIVKGDFSNSTPNLPQRIAVLGEANTANQGALSLTPVQITSAQEAGDLYGFGSPIYNMMRILHPVNGGGIGGIPVIVYPQAVAGGAVAAAREITVTGAAATGNATHKLVINGRDNVNGEFYTFNVVTGDTPTIIAGKISDVINLVLASPVIGSSLLGVATATAKWEGLTSEELDVVVNDGGNGVGITYAVLSSATGLATPSITAALALFGSAWNTIVVNPYGEPVNDALEAFNGIPDPITPTGRYQGIIMKPFIALFGSKLDDPSSLTNPRLVEVTNSVCPAPLSKGWDMEAAANMTVLFGRKAQDEPHLDVNALSYPDMPIPADGDIGSMAAYDFRDLIIQKGCSTVDLVADRYEVQDFVTTYHPVGETPPQFAYCRNLMLDFNVRFSYYLLEQIHVVDHVIAADDDIVSATNVIKPKQWILIVGKLAEDLANRGLVTDVDFTKESILSGLSATNPDRLETSFPYKRTGIARIASTTVKAGFNFGEVA